MQEPPSTQSLLFLEMCLPGALKSFLIIKGGDREKEKEKEGAEIER